MSPEQLPEACRTPRPEDPLEYFHWLADRGKVVGRSDGEMEASRLREAIIANLHHLDEKALQGFALSAIRAVIAMHAPSSRLAAIGHLANVIQSLEDAEAKRLVDSKRGEA
jgi:hypothetical protein